MPLSDHEQRILDEIEKRLAEDDPNFVEQVGRTDLYSHHTRGIRLSAVAFLLGCVLLLLIRVLDLDRARRVRHHGVVGADDLPVPRAARPRPDPRDAGGRRVLHHRSDRSDRRAVPSDLTTSRRPDDDLVVRPGDFSHVTSSTLATHRAARCTTGALPRASTVRPEANRFPIRSDGDPLRVHVGERAERVRGRMEGFTAHQACKFTGCSPRQLRYWDQVGLVRALGAGHRRPSGDPAPLRLP